MNCFSNVNIRLANVGDIAIFEIQCRLSNRHFRSFLIVKEGSYQFNLPLVDHKLCLNFIRFVTLGGHLILERIADNLEVILESEIGN